ncbi:hypothetical protein SAMN05421835_11140 [Amycolatopsis sacchari]|uniref:Uncharacterized protein n=1 Tax=Amycolatopsis sacchari TaxID=115433 RepID=A0A1I3VJ37_9PSEU|nr:hypothetical protein SAMN05421835_11140 [Amycolatopsis sacchari]
MTGAQLPGDGAGQDRAWIVLSVIRARICSVAARGELWLMRMPPSPRSRISPSCAAPGVKSAADWKSAVFSGAQDTTSILPKRSRIAPASAGISHRPVP